jgi:hypothetical protein
MSQPLATRCYVSWVQNFIIYQSTCVGGIKDVEIHTTIQPLWKYKVVEIWPGQTVTCLHTNSPGNIWTTLYMEFCFLLELYLLLIERLLDYWILPNFYEGSNMSVLFALLVFKFQSRFSNLIEKLLLILSDMFYLLLLLRAFTTHLRVLSSLFLRFRDHTQWHDIIGRTPLDEWSARRRDLYLTTLTTLITDKHDMFYLNSVNTRFFNQPMCHVSRLTCLL